MQLLFIWVWWDVSSFISSLSVFLLLFCPFLYVSHEKTCSWFSNLFKKINKKRICIKQPSPALPETTALRKKRTAIFHTWHKKGNRSVKLNISANVSGSGHITGARLCMANAPSLKTILNYFCFIFAWCRKLGHIYPLWFCLLVHVSLVLAVKGMLLKKKPPEH